MLFFFSLYKREKKCFERKIAHGLFRRANISVHHLSKTPWHSARKLLFFKPKYPEQNILLYVYIYFVFCSLKGNDCTRRLQDPTARMSLLEILQGSFLSCKASTFGSNVVSLMK